MNRAFLAGLAMQLAVLCFPPLMLVFDTELEKRVRRKHPGRDDRRGIPNGVKGHT